MSDYQLDERLDDSLVTESSNNAVLAVAAAQLLANQHQEHDSLPTESLNEPNKSQHEQQQQLSTNGHVIDPAMSSEAIQHKKQVGSSDTLILKAINRRKLQLACPICSSCVVNMSDHLVKKHAIKDRNERKYLMDLVRKTYLKMSVSQSSSVTLPTPPQDVQKQPPKPVVQNKLASKVVEQPSDSGQFNLNSGQNNRKFIKCPICLDDNKYFVNISDHLIKIHHLVTSEMRKPILKQIKENSTLSINKNQFDLVFSNNLNRKIKFDPQLSKSLLDQQQQQQLQEQFQQQQQQQVKGPAEVRSDADQLISEIFNDALNTSNVSSNSDRRQNRKTLLKSKTKQVSEEYEPPPIDETPSCTQPPEQLNNEDNQLPDRHNNAYDNNSALITDDDIADYSDLIGFNYEPFSVGANKPFGLNESNLIINNFEMEPNELPYGTATTVTNEGVKEQNEFLNAVLENNLNDSFLRANKRKTVRLDVVTKKMKRTKFALKEANHASYYENEPGDSNENEEHEFDDLYAAASGNQMNQMTEYEESANLSHFFKSQSLEPNDVPCHVSNKTNTCESPPYSSSSNSSPCGVEQLAKRTGKHGLNTEAVETGRVTMPLSEMWHKLNGVEQNLNKTLKGFGVFTDNLMKQIQAFTNQFQTAITQIDSFKKSLLEMDESLINTLTPAPTLKLPIDQSGEASKRPSNSHNDSSSNGKRSSLIQGKRYSFSSAYNTQSVSQLQDGQY